MRFSTLRGQTPPQAVQRLCEGSDPQGAVKNNSRRLSATAAPSATAPALATSSHTRSRDVAMLVDEVQKACLLSDPHLCDFFCHEKSPPLPPSSVITPSPHRVVATKKLAHWFNRSIIPLRLERPLDAGHGLWPWTLARGRPEPVEGRAERVEGRRSGATGSARGDPLWTMDCF